MRSHTLILLAMLSCTPLATLSASSTDTAVRHYLNRHAFAVHAPIAVEIPSFSRQTGLSCSACHTSFPQLNAFGRAFKLGGYTLSSQQTVEQKDSSGTALKINLIPPLSAMHIASVSNTGTAQPEAQNGNVDFPQQLGLFLAGAITPNLGGFLQITYDPAGGNVLDNVDLRLAGRGSLGSRSLVYGLTLNNNPTIDWRCAENVVNYLQVGARACSDI
ncbi:MAG: hypothetical protein E4H37_05085 [Gemmatimonadales bacterium]|nr:MAG: hypothetical protein E4H37_05085 [Gemmatimonadales bacterium]